jgi:hypothetical protein
MSRAAIRNQLLQRLTDDDFAALEPLLERVTLTDQQDLSMPGAVIEHLHFPESGICSIEAIAPGSEAIEVGLVGWEGVTDHVMDRGDRSVLRVFVQVPGSAFAVRAHEYADWIAGRPQALRLMVRYQQAMTIQISYTALAHGSFALEERLARLLLMLFDRVDGDVLAFVHDRLAKMLSVRRASVTTAMHMLEGFGALKSIRGQVIMRDRAALESLAAGAYGTPEREYRRLLGPIPAR